MMPTVNCLVSLSMTPFFVCSLDEIEVVFFERVGAMIKNFDLVIIYKDYSKTVSFINAIPILYKDQIKFGWTPTISFSSRARRVSSGTRY